MIDGLDSRVLVECNTFGRNTVILSPPLEHVQEVLKLRSLQELQTKTRMKMKHLRLRIQMIGPDCLLCDWLLNSGVKWWSLEIGRAHV